VSTVTRRQTTFVIWVRLIALAVGLVLLAACSSSHGSPAPGPSSGTRGPSLTPSPSVSDGAAAELPGFPTAPSEPGLPTPSTTAQVQQFISAVFTDAQQDWSKVFATAGATYVPAKLVLFSSVVNTGCGTESSEVGPFYCPADHTVYLDVVFFDEMEQRYGVAGDFAQAYVVAHEVGHHIQTITGVTGQVAQLQQNNPGATNSLSILTELQADCYAGVWAHSTYQRGLLEPGDIDEALTAAAAVGDDFLQKSATGTINPEQWTHGSSAQRQQWLTKGYETGQPSSCDTFAAGAG
jgi:predicted metalloprotease